MRIVLTCLFALVFTGCTGTSAPPASPPDSEPAVDAAPDPAPAAAPTEGEGEAIRPEMTPIPPATPVDKPRDIALVGYGVRMALNPPFQAMRMGAWLGAEGKETVVVSWWDVKAEGAGVVGHAGLYNTTIIPGKAEEAGAEFATTYEETKTSKVAVLRLGTDGTEVRLQEGHDHLGGCGELTAVPFEAGWSLEVDGKKTPWPEGPLLHSTDPASGKPADFLERPLKPWGPWPDGPGGAGSTQPGDVAPSDAGDTKTP